MSGQDVRSGAAHDAWGGAFRDAWHTARPAGRRRAAQLAVGLPRFEVVTDPGLRMPISPPPSPEAWAAGLRDDGTFATAVDAAPQPGA